MGETGIVRFPGNLDPRAQEFRPQNRNHSQLPFFPLPPPVYYPYTECPQNDEQVVSFTDGRCVAYPPLTPIYPLSQPHTPPAYVSTLEYPPLQPPSSSATRTLVLSSVPCDVSESLVRRELEVFGEVRGVQMERVVDGIVTVHFYDLRHAERASKEIREQHMQQQSRLRNQYCALMMMQQQQLPRNSASFEVGGESLVVPMPLPARGLIAGRAVWAHFIIPASNAVPDGCNQGTIVVFNLDSDVSSTTLKDIFGVFGAVKELRETPLKKQQRFVEFYDIRDAAKALKEMNGKELQGKHVVIEFSRPGGCGRKFFYAASKSLSTTATNMSVIDSTNTHPTRASSYRPSLPLTLPGGFSGRSHSNVPRSFNSQNRLPTKKSSNSNKGNNPNGGINSKSTVYGPVELSLHSLSLGGAVDSGTEEKLASGAIKKSIKKSSQKGQPMKQQQPRSKPWKGRQVKKFDARFLINEDAMVESNSFDTRTTVMIKNIPNKYSQKLLLNMLDNHCIHCNEQIADGDDQPMSSYDFVYLPIDFNNKCNVGYGFVNMTSAQATLRLYKAFHLQNWEVFNSRKICEVTYARVQGLQALKEHFKNSKFACEMDHYLPVVFSPPRDGRQLTEPQPIVGNREQQPTIVGLTTNPGTSFYDHEHDEMDGADMFKNGNNDCHYDDVDQCHEELIGGSCSSTNGGDIGDDDDDDMTMTVAVTTWPR
ncbi:RRM_1 domain-containing protein/RRM_2 domain-containing protein [Cephalotus follicularis]|uniref:RRM_1 domain-containing protein/RRM_2 domain-containing protein n=1 Tax=Cephalotus follicularis TaxID=3775 RepID=A0A1Q3AVX6_CEPFO|nr:RRM_1 domain-containing protein/RRM_2 domain-containing protein [Cephalotus follicularis]